MVAIWLPRLILRSYGKCSIGEPFSLTSNELDLHFEYSIKSEVEAVNNLFKKRLFEILSDE